jgi:hypothetical protein
MIKFIWVLLNLKLLHLNPWTLESLLAAGKLESFLIELCLLKTF